MKSFHTVAETLTTRYPYYRSGVGAELAKVLRRLVDPENVAAAYGNIDRAIKFAQTIRQKRSIHEEKIIDADPLAITKVLSELSAGAPKPVDETTILAAILYPVLRLKRAAAFDPADPADADLISGFLRQIGGSESEKGVFPGKLGAEVEKLVRNTLRVSEINLGAQADLAIPGMSSVPSQTDAERTQAFRHMVMEAVEDPRAMLLRGSQWSIHMQQLIERNEDESTEKTRQKIERCAELTEKVYIPLVTAYGYDHLKKRLQDQLFRMTDPIGYENISGKILGRLKDSAPEGKENYVRDHKSGSRIVLQHIEERLRNIVPKQYLIQIESRIKTPYSAQDKQTRKPGNDKDLIALRIIVDAGAFDDSERAREERKAVAAIYRSIIIETKKKEKKGIGGLRQIPGEADDYYANPKPSGYLAIHDTFAIDINDGGGVRTAQFELQIVDKSAHFNNQEGTASHKKYKSLPTQPDETAKHTVSVFGPDNSIVTVSRPATAADFLATALGPEGAFSTAYVKVNRTGHHFDIDPKAMQPDGLRTTLMPGDRIAVALDPAVKYSKLNRQTLIEACAVPETKRVMINYDRELRGQSGADAEVPGREDAFSLRRFPIKRARPI
ncbi:MAG: HD domain-containing protein [Pseudomonadota bacterium]|nr:HD domain-containing protein [Pseudomonadota bacterium]